MPNFITIFRLLLIPIFLVLISRPFSTYKLALLVFILACVSDALDGFIARKAKTITQIGKFIDPMADKLLLVSAFIALAMIGKMPVWLTIIVISRDMIIFLGWLGVYIITEKKSIKPTLISKINTFFQMLTVIAALVNSGFKSEIYVITALTTTLSGIHYMFKTGLSFTSNKADSND